MYIRTYVCTYVCTYVHTYTNQPESTTFHAHHAITIFCLLLSASFVVAAVAARPCAEPAEPATNTDFINEKKQPYFIVRVYKSIILVCGIHNYDYWGL